MGDLVESLKEDGGLSLRKIADIAGGGGPWRVLALQARLGFPGSLVCTLVKMEAGTDGHRLESNVDQNRFIINYTLSLL